MINGMPIQFLNGIDDNYNSSMFGADIMDVLTGRHLDGFGLGSVDDDDKKMYDYLVATRNTIQSNPAMVASIQNPQGMLKMFNYAIDNWFTPNRDKALEILEKEEERLIKSGAILLGIDDDELLGLQGVGLDGFFKSVSKAIKKGVKKAATGIKNAAKFVITRLNPVMIAARGGFLVALKLNMNHISSKIAPGYATLEQAKQQGMSEANHKAAVEALKKTQDLFVKKLFGKSSAFKKAVLSGGRKKWTKGIVASDKEVSSAVENNKAELSDLDTGANDEPESSVKGLGLVEMAAGAAAAAPFIVKATNFVKNLFNNEERRAFIDKAKEAGSTAKEARQAWRQVKDKKGGIIDKVTNLVKQESSAENTQDVQSQTQPSNQTQDITQTSEIMQQTTQNTNSMENPNPSLASRIFTPKNILIGVSVTVAAVAIYKVATSKSSTQKSLPAPQSSTGLSGVRRKKAKKTKSKSVPAGRKTTTTRRKKVKSLKLK